jgi:hypothetical protein
VLLAHLPPDSATYREIDPKGAEAASWSRTDHLLASVFDSLQMLLWQNGNQGKKSPSPRPRPLPRPGMEGKGRQVKGTPMPLNELRKRLPGIEGANDAG